jgi:tetratricopeptide (TPR) repeat protein
VEYSHSNLSESAQQLLLCLAPFSGFIWRDAIISGYTEELKKLEPFNDYDFAGFDDAIQEAINWGLLSPIDAGNDRLLSIQPVFPYFLQTRLNQTDAGITTALANGFKNYYRELIIFYGNLFLSGIPEENQLGIFYCRQEYENIYTALQISLRRQESFINIYFCLYKYFDIINDTQGQLKIAEMVNQFLEKYPAVLIQGDLGEENMLSKHYLANAYFQLRQYGLAKASYEQKLIIIQNLQSVETQQKLIWNAVTYTQLGDVMLESKEQDEARRYYQQALVVFIKFGIKGEQSGIYHQMGRVAQDLGDWEEASRYFKQSLAIKIECGNQRGKAATLYMLGIVAQELMAWDEAIHYYQQALEVFIDFGDHHSQAKTYHQFGVVAKKIGELEKARHYLQQSLSLFMEFGSNYEKAGTYGQLGLVAKAEGDLEDAKENLLRALEIFVEFNDKHSIKMTIINLGRVYQLNSNLEIIKAVIKISGFSESEVQQIFDAMDQGT